MATQTADRPIDQYRTIDEFGEHEITLENGTRRANRLLVSLFNATHDVLVREMIRYVHGDRNEVPPSVVNAVAAKTGGALVVRWDGDSRVVRTRSDGV